MLWCNTTPFYFHLNTFISKDTIGGWYCRIGVKAILVVNNQVTTYKMVLHIIFICKLSQRLKVVESSIVPSIILTPKLISVKSSA